MEIDPLEVLKEDLKDENVEIQLEAVHSLSTIAIALGTQRTANELFVTLDKYCFPVDIQAAKSPEVYANIESLNAKEEVLVAIAEELTPDFVEYCGGSKLAAKHMLPLLEKLAMAEETVIRQAAVTSFVNVLDKMKTEEIKSAGLPVLTRLAEAEWFTSRVSATYLSPKLYQLLNSDDDRTIILDIHKRLCSDDMPMVKNDAFKNLVLLINHMNSHNLIASYVKPLLVQLTNELMENLRQTMVDIIKKISEKSQEQENKQEIVTDFIKITSEDDSWRVRKHLAEELAPICEHLDKAIINDVILPLYIKLLQDREPQVRKASISSLESMIKTTDGNIFVKPITNGPLQALANDMVGEVREALAEQVASLGFYMDKTQAKEKLLPILKKLAADESPHARLNLCSKLADVCTILGIDLFEGEVLPLLKEVTIDQKWRVRNSIVKNIASIGIQMGKEKFAKSRLREILVQSLKDPAATVRDTAAEQVKMLLLKFNYDWMAQNIFSEMKAIYSSSGNYLHRMIPLKTVQLIAPYLSPSQIKSEFGDLLSKALEDNISNVRFAACRVLKEILPRADSEVRAQFKIRLQQLVNKDTDNDVQFFGNAALNVC